MCKRWLQFPGTVLLALLGLWAASPAAAQDPVNQPGGEISLTAWEGLWQLEDSPFTVRVLREENNFSVEPVETLGFVWLTRNGKISGNQARIEVEYQGVLGRVLIELLDEHSASAQAEACIPDYHLVCALVRDKLARFIRVEQEPE